MSDQRETALPSDAPPPLKPPPELENLAPGARGPNTPTLRVMMLLLFHPTLARKEVAQACECKPAMVNVAMFRIEQAARWAQSWLEAHGLEVYESDPLKPAAR